MKLDYYSAKYLVKCFDCNHTISSYNDYHLALKSQRNAKRAQVNKHYKHNVRVIER